MCSEFATILRGGQGQTGPEPVPAKALNGVEGQPVATSTPEPVEESGSEASELDPLAVALSVPGGASAPAAPEGAGAGPRVAPAPLAVELSLVEQIVKRVVWGGDRRRGVARIELDGELAGTTIWVRGEGREVALEIEAGPGLDGTAMSSRLADRLRARGLDLATVELR